MKSAEKNNKRNKKKLLYIVISVAIGLIILSGVVTAFILNYNTSSPETIEVLDDGVNVYIKADMNDNYLKYRFRFVDSDEQEIIIIIESDSNILSVDELLEEGIVPGQTYEISVCYLSENSGNNSEYSSSIEWTVYKNLAQPTLSIDEENQDLLVWQEVENADYYTVYISGLDSIVTTDASLSKQELEGGERGVYVVACSNYDYYRDSIPSNQLQIEVIHEFSPFESVSFDNSSKLLTIIGDEQLSSIDLYLDGQEHRCIEFETIENQGSYTFLIDLSQFYRDGMTIGACPDDEDEYNIYNGEIVYAVGFEPAE